jgi:glycosyltransferase involved in cell wall biosynthesis
MTSGDAIVTFSPWDTWRDARVREFCRPPDQVYKTLASSDRVRRLLVADPWRSRPIDLVRRAQGRRADFPTSDSINQLRPLGVRRRDPGDRDALRRGYRRYGTLLRAHASRLGMHEPALVTFNPFVAGFASFTWCRSVVYYARDDWTAFRRNTHLVAAMRAAHEELQTRGVVVCAVSRVLADRVAGPGRGVVIANGVDPDVWARPAPAPSAMGDLPRPRGAYAGTVDDRLDAEALLALVRSGTLASVAVIGPVADEQIGRRLAAESGIHLLGRLGQRELAGSLMAADICLLPHVVSFLTEAMSPLKLYEYLASGAPVVATDLPPVRDVDPRVVLVRDGDYQAAVATGLAAGRRSEADRLAFVEANSWRRRHETLLDLMFGAPAPATLTT